MNLNSKKARIAVMASLLAIALYHVAGAYPTRGGSCTNCHSSSGSGSLAASPNPLDVQLGNSGLLTFSISSLGNSSVAAISVQGLENPALNASIGSGGDNWTHRTNATYGMSYVSDSLVDTGTYALDLAIGNSATPGMYPITVMFCGDGPVGVAYSPGFNLQVTMAGLAGDYNNDHIVNAADYTFWRNGLGSTYTQADYTVWKTHFGESAAASATLVSNAVPEPATLASVAVGLLAMTFWLARPRSHPGNSP